MGRNTDNSGAARTQRVRWMAAAAGPTVRSNVGSMALDSMLWNKGVRPHSPAVTTPSIVVPNPPTAVSASAGNERATVTFTPPVNNGGSAITLYTVTSSPGGITVDGSSSPINVTDLSNGIAYTFTVVAKNSVGNSVASLASSPVTPNIVLTRTVFTSGSGSWTAPSGVESVDYLVVGGGGGGGSGAGTGAGGGGGGGSLKTGTLSVTPGYTYNYTVGSGGAGGPTPGINEEANGVSGESSVFATITAEGGGFGHKSRETNGSGIYGRGGAAQLGDTPTTGGSGGNVRDGGEGNPDQGAGGGGGGAGGAGFTSTSNGTDNNRGGTGGSGVSSDLTGASVIYGAGGKGADEGTFTFIGPRPGANGTANTGNGGGGGASHNGGNNAATGGNGGSGIVVLNYSS